MNRILKAGLIVGAAGIIAGGIVVAYIFLKPHRNIAKEKPAYIMKAEDLYSDYSKDEMTSNEKYLNKVIQISGKVSSVSLEKNGANISLIDPMEGIGCSFDSITAIKSADELSKISEGDMVNLKGQCDGYDMIMGVVLTRCVLVKE